MSKMIRYTLCIIESLNSCAIFLHIYCSVSLLMRWCYKETIFRRLISFSECDSQKPSFHLSQIHWEIYQTHSNVILSYFLLLMINEDYWSLGWNALHSQFNSRAEIWDTNISWNKLKWFNFADRFDHDSYQWS